MVRIRTKREIGLIAESCQIVADTVEMLAGYMKSGVSLSELDKLAEDYIRRRGARPAFKGYMGFPSTLCISVDDEVVHGIPSNRMLENGQIVGVDCGAEKNGYYGDHARTFSIGFVNQEKQKLIDITHQALMLGIKEAKVGNYISDIGHAIQTHVEQNGFSVVRELVGHGIGTELHEDPQIPNYGLPKQGNQLKEGMCLAIEPMVNMGSKEIMTDSDGWTVRTKDGQSSAHFEHTIAIQEGEAKILSTIQNNNTK